MIEDPGPARAMGVARCPDHVGDDQVDRLVGDDLLNAGIGLFVKIETFVEAERSRHSLGEQAPQDRRFGRQGKIVRLDAEILGQGRIAGNLERDHKRNIQRLLFVVGMHVPGL